MPDIGGDSAFEVELRELAVTLTFAAGQRLYAVPVASASSRVNSVWRLVASSVRDISAPRTDDRTSPPHG